MDKKVIGNTLLVGHRGSPDNFYENTLESFKKAIELKLDMIETDIRRTKDGVMVLHHDPKINGKLILSMAYDELLKESLKRGFKVPILDELLLLCQGKIKLDLELKEAGYEEEILEKVCSYLKPDEFIISSFHQSSVRKVKEKFPEIKTGLIIEGIFSVFFKIKWKAFSFDFIIPDRRLFSFGLDRILRKFNINALTWTVNKKSQMKKLFTNPRVKGIITNLPELLLQTRQELWDK